MASRDIEQQLMELKQRFLEDQIGPEAYQAERAEPNLCLPLAGEARDRFNMRTQEMQTRAGKLSELQDQFVEAIRVLMRENALTALLVALDGLDELLEPEAGAASIVHFLPPPERLPEGCQVLLTSRERLGSYTDRALQLRCWRPGFAAARWRQLRGCFKCSDTNG